MEAVGRFCRKGMVAKNTLMFQVEMPPGTFPSFVPGQYVYLEWKNLPATLKAGDGRSFSIASSPDSLPVLSFATRLTGSPFKNALLSVPNDSLMLVSGPYGEFCLPGCIGERRTSSWEMPIVLISGGIGITPYRSMLLYSIGACQNMSFFLFTTNPTLEDSPFRDELEELSRNHKNLFLCQYVSRSAGLPASAVNAGPLTSAKILGFLGEKAQKAQYFISGPPSLVTSFKNGLLSAGILAGRIHSDPFFGYV